MNKTTLFFICLFIGFSAVAQAPVKGKVTLSGYIRHDATGEPLIGATLYFPSIQKGTATNAYGFYSISLDKGTYPIQVNYIGFQGVTDTIELTQNITRAFNLAEATITTQTITITDEVTRQNVESTQMSTVELTMETIKKVPAIFGEIDLLKTIQLLPGVKSSGEGNAGFYVRGGGPDQNLILLDNATVYNASHLFGFFSVFNSDAIRSVNLVKGGMPAQYGGRLSSVLDISMKEGNMKKFHGAGGIGLIATRLTFDGPIVEDKLSYLISGRRTYIDALLAPFAGEGSQLNGNSYYFYDLNAKLQWKIGEKDRLFFSGYYGKDAFRFRSPSSDLAIDIPWGNAIASLRWNHQFGSKLFLNTTFSFTDYVFSTNADSENFSFGLNSGIRDFNIKTDWDWMVSPKHFIKFGTEMVYHRFTPSTARARIQDTEIVPERVQHIYAHDWSVYFQDEFSVGSRWKFNAGFRLTYFQHTGPFDRYVKNEEGVNIDTLRFGTLENIQDYLRPEPRFSARFRINENSSLKGAVTLNYQNLHLANLATVSLPTDVWLPSTSLIKLQQAFQANLGYFRNFLNNTIETSVEVYFKHMSNLVEYKDNSSFADIINDNPDNVLAFGQGRSYGAEFFVKKAVGKWTGWIGYTLAWTQRYGFDKSLVNYDGDFFYPRYDRRHDIAITLSYDVSPRWNLGAVFVYSTGNALAVPSSYYFVGTQLVPNFEDRDNFRLADYHRLDVSATYRLNKPEAKWRSELNISVYNLYSRLNPFFVFFDIEQNPDDQSVGFKGKQVSLFPIIPSITWNFSF